MRARIAIATSLALTFLGATGALPAAAHHPSVTEYQTGLSMNAGPWDLVDGGDGRMWFTEEAAGAFGPLSPGESLVGVVVRDFARRRNILVRAGHHYLAPAPRRAARLRF